MRKIYIHTATECADCLQETGLAAATTYVVLAINPAVLGLAAHATHFVILFTLVGLVLLLVSVAVNSLARLLMWRVRRGPRRGPGLLSRFGLFTSRPMAPVEAAAPSDAPLHRGYGLHICPLFVYRNFQQH